MNVNMFLLHYFTPNISVNKPGHLRERTIGFHPYTLYLNVERAWPSRVSTIVSKTYIFSLV